jgi:major membrane immunogen (membrane-anchored lipoprotein)
MLVLCLVLTPLCIATAQQGKNTSAKGSVTGNYEGTAKNRAEEVIQVKFELTEKEGAMSGMIRSDHGDFTITGGSHKGDDVTLDFDANGTTGTITLKLAEGKLAGTWSAGDDGGPVDLKRVAAQEETPKGKS